MRITVALRFVTLFVMASVVGAIQSPLHLASRQVPKVAALAVNSWDNTVDTDEHLQILASLAYQRWLDAQPDIPVRLQIDSIGLNAKLEQVVLNDSGQVGVPEDPSNVGWLNRTVIPGWEGSSLVDGHFDTATGPAVFYRLKDVRLGDSVIVLDASGVAWKFVVDGINSITIITDGELHDTLPQELFATRGPRTLTLTTCYGSWNRRYDTYDQRLLVHTTLVR